jgi:hypothetical protein
MNITKEKAITEIDDLIKQIPQVANAGRKSAIHIRWLSNCDNVLKKIFGKKSTFYIAFLSLQWKKTGKFIVLWDETIEDHHHQAFLQCLEMAKGIFLSAIDEINRTDEIKDIFKDKIEIESNSTIRLHNTINNKFRTFFRKEPINEKEVQDEFEKLLSVADFSYTREKDRIVYSSKTYMPDFVLSELNMALELKICNRERREKEIISEINDDILAYNTKYKNLMFIIYDIGQIRDVELFKSSFTVYENVFINVVKH